MKPMLSIFQCAIKYDYQFLAIFRIFFWFTSFVFYKLAPPPKQTFQNVLKSFFESSPVQKTVSEVLNSGIFLILHFDRQANGGCSSTPPPPATPSLATLLCRLTQDPRPRKTHSNLSNQPLWWSLILPFSTKYKKLYWPMLWIKIICNTEKKFWWLRI